MTDKVKVFGWDLTAQAIKGIDEGWVVAVVQQDPYQEGVAGVESILKLKKGETVPASIDIPVTIVTKENVDKFRELVQVIPPERGWRPLWPPASSTAERRTSDARRRRPRPHPDGAHHQALRRRAVARRRESRGAGRRGSRPRRRQRRRQVDAHEGPVRRRHARQRPHLHRRRQPFAWSRRPMPAASASRWSIRTCRSATRSTSAGNVMLGREPKRHILGLAVPRQEGHARALGRDARPARHPHPRPAHQGRVSLRRPAPEHRHRPRRLLRSAAC